MTSAHGSKSYFSAIPRATKSGYFDYDDFGGYSYHGGGKVECCPLVVKPLVLVGIIALIGVATAFLDGVIAMTTFNMGGRRRRRRRGLGVNVGELDGYFFKGKTRKCKLVVLYYNCQFFNHTNEQKLSKSRKGKA